MLGAAPPELPDDVFAGDELVFELELEEVEPQAEAARAAAASRTAAHQRMERLLEMDMNGSLFKVGSSRIEKRRRARGLRSRLPCRPTLVSFTVSAHTFCPRCRLQEGIEHLGVTLSRQTMDQHCSQEPLKPRLPRGGAKVDNS